MESTFVSEVKTDPKDTLTCEIGDSKQPDFIPQVKLMRWDNEINFSARLIVPTTDPESYQKIDDVVNWTKGSYEVNWYQNTEFSDEGGLEFEVKLTNIPTTNVFTFSLKSKGVEAFYQPSLTKEFQVGQKYKSWVIKEVTDTDAVAEDGTVVSHRPEHIVGSYAVYYQGKPANFEGGKLYRSGKAFHIYRPKAIDAKGDSVWGVLKIDILSELMTITFDKDWLNNATYPVTIDPNFGYESIGASTDTDDNTPQVCFATSTPASSGSLTSMSLYCNINGGAPRFTPALYSSVAGVPTTLLASVADGAGTLVGSSLAWISTNITYASITSGTQYWLGNKSGVTGGNAYTVRRDSGTNETIYLSTGDGAFPNPWDVVNSTPVSYRYSIYATYTAAVTNHFLSSLGVGS